MIQICVNRQNILFQRNFEYHMFWKYMLFRASFSDLLRSRRKIKNSIPVFLRSSPCLYPQGLKTGLIRLKHQPCPHPIRNHHIVLFLCYNLQQQQKKKGQGDSKTTALLCRTRLFHCNIHNHNSDPSWIESEKPI